MQRPMGSGCNPRLSGRMADLTLAEASASLPPLLKGGDGVSTDRGRQNGIQRGDHPSGNWDGERLYLQYFPGPQERWGPQANNQSEKIKRVYPTPSFQDGGNTVTYAKRSLEKRGFYG